MTKNIDVVRDFLYGVINKSKNMFSERDKYDENRMVLYSYGKHFTLAKEHYGMYLINTKTYSLSTKKHQFYVNSVIPEDKKIFIADCNPHLCLKQVEEDEEEIKEYRDLLSRARSERRIEELNNLIEKKKINIERLQPFVREENLKRLEA